MLFRITYFIPWDEAYLIPIFDGNPNVTKKTEDTGGVMFESKIMSVRVKPEKHKEDQLDS